MEGKRVSSNAKIHEIQQTVLLRLSPLMSLSPSVTTVFVVCGPLNNDDTKRDSPKPKAVHERVDALHRMLIESRFKREKKMQKMSRSKKYLSKVEIVNFAAIR